MTGSFSVISPNMGWSFSRTTRMESLLAHLRRAFRSRILPCATSRALWNRLDSTSTFSVLLVLAALGRLVLLIFTAARQAPHVRGFPVAQALLAKQPGWRDQLERLSSFSSLYKRNFTWNTCHQTFRKCEKRGPARKVKEPMLIKVTHAQIQRKSTSASNIPLV